MDSRTRQQSRLDPELRQQRSEAGRTIQAGVPSFDAKMLGEIFARSVKAQAGVAESYRLTLRRTLGICAEELASSIPGFDSMWLVRDPSLSESQVLVLSDDPEKARNDELAAVERGLCLDAPIPLVLCTRGSMDELSLAKVSTALRRVLGGARVQLRQIDADRLAETVLDYRQGHDLLESRKLLAGHPRRVDELCESPWGRPAPRAAQRVLEERLELLLRCFPDPVMLRYAGSGGFDGPVGFSSAPNASIELSLAFAELCRAFGDALLLSCGHYRSSREERGRELLELYPEPSSRKNILAWAYGPSPVEAGLPDRASALWYEIREFYLQALGQSIEKRSGKALATPLDLLRTLRDQKSGFWARLSKSVLARHPRGCEARRELILTLLLGKRQDGTEDIGLVSKGSRLLADAGGPLLAHQTWTRLRAEALMLRDFEDRLPPYTGNEVEIPASVKTLSM